MTHEALCPARNNDELPIALRAWEPDCQCDLIQQVRAETLREAALRVNQHAMALYLRERRYEDSGDWLDSWDHAVFGTMEEAHAEAK